MYDHNNLIHRARELTALTERTTPGPWHCKPNSWDGLRLCKRSQSGDVVISDVLSTEHAWDNGILAAHAPELAQLLAEMADALDALNTIQDGE